MKRYVYQRLKTWMFIVISFIVASNSKQSKYPLIIGKWVSDSNNWRIPINIKELLIYATKCMNTKKKKKKKKKSTMLSEKSQIQKQGTKDYMSYDSIYVKFCNRQNWRSVVVRDWQGGARGKGGSKCGEDVCPKSGYRKTFDVTCSVSWL